MNRITTAALTVSALAAAASAQTVYDTSVTPGWFVGSGQPNANFVVSNNAGADVQTGLSSFYRYGVRNPGDNALRDSLVNNVYTYRNGEAFTDGTATTVATGTAAWNFNFHANLAVSAPGNTVSTSLVLLTIDWDPTAGTDLRTYNYSNLYALLGGPNLSLVQGSENLGFSYWTNGAFLAITGSTAPSAPFNPFATGTYEFNLTVMNGGVVSSSVDMFVNVVPTPGAAAALGLGGLAAMRRRRR